jgi:hypothetical protein
MKPNRSNQPGNLVARTWMPLALMLLGVMQYQPTAQEHLTWSDGY